MISPQIGFQQQFVSTRANVAVGGGAAGVGKSFALLVLPIYAMGIKDFKSVIFRREQKQVSISGGLWDEGMSLYMNLGNSKPIARSQAKEFVWPSGAKVSFEHLHHESDIYKFQGLQAAYIAFDELTHFEKTMFWYMLSRNRSVAFDAPFVRATTNPQGDGWVKELVSWFLYPPDYTDQNIADFPILERSGVLRYFRRFENEMVWGETVEEVCDKMPDGNREKNKVLSFTFIAGALSENKILNEKDPSYRARLESLDETSRMQLLQGRWRNADEEKELLFDRAAILDLSQNDFVIGDGKKKYITVDAALEGSDPMVIFAWSGWRVIDVMYIEKSNGAQVIELIKQMQIKHSVPNRQVCFDADGVGGFIKGYISGATAFNGNGAVVKINGVREEYKNLRAQCFYHAARKVNNSDAFYAHDRYFPDLKNELLAHRKGRSADGEFFIEPKSAIKTRLGGRSPNFADAFMMRSIFDFTEKYGKYDIASF
jgi:hypothetical protein